MAIVKKSATTAKPQPTPPPAGPVLIELVNVQRYVWRNVLYTQGVIYSCDPEQAEEFLNHTVEDKNVFRRYIKKAERPKVDEVPTMPVPTPAKLDPTAKATDKRIDIGTPEEIADLGLPPEGEEDTTEV